MSKYAEVIFALTEMKSDLLSEESELIEAAAAASDLMTDEELSSQNEIADDEVFYEYMDSVLRRLQDIGLSEDDAAGTFLAVADAMAAEGDLPSLPEGDGDAYDYTEWLAAARSSGFESVVLDTVGR